MASFLSSWTAPLAVSKVEQVVNFWEILRLVLIFNAHLNYLNGTNITKSADSS